MVDDEVHKSEPEYRTITCGTDLTQVGSTRLQFLTYYIYCSILVERHIACSYIASCIGTLVNTYAHIMLSSFHQMLLLLIKILIYTIAEYVIQTYALQLQVKKLMFQHFFQGVTLSIEMDQVKQVFTAEDLPTKTSR